MHKCIHYFIHVVAASGKHLKIFQVGRPADTNESTLVLHSTTLVAAKADLPEHNKLKLSSVSIVQVEQL